MTAIPRVDDISELGVLENDASVRVPRATQVRSSIARTEHASIINDVLGQVRAVEVAVGGDGSITNRLDVTVLEPHLRELTKDEIDSSTDVRLGITLTAGIRVHGILIASNVAAVEAACGRVDEQRDGLAELINFGLGVGDVKVVYFHGARFEAQRTRHRVAFDLNRSRDVLLRHFVRDSHLVISVRLRVARVSLHHQRSVQLRNHRLLLVDTREPEEAVLRRRVG